MDIKTSFNNEVTLNQFIDELIKFRDNNNCGELMVWVDGYCQPVSGIILENERETYSGITPPYINIY
ncbi:hypothetical protein [Turicibacter sp. T129]|uniref:hypothetical protein n=1 Tax=Turicibacter sp. T129 TaxID=2951141 RepID=UPI0021D4F395|nr:hypothetical protein [Turicibacter sp. T129]MCU7194117.1 hypothetical protein [Turicibacter sp. T129]